MLITTTSRRDVCCLAGHIAGSALRPGDFFLGALREADAYTSDPSERVAYIRGFFHGLAENFPDGIVLDLRGCLR